MTFGSAVLTALPVGPVPSVRETWDNPRRYPLNRPYGDEFEYTSYAQMFRRWKSRTTVAADFRFPTGSHIEWKPPSSGAAIWTPAPAGDFEAVLEVGIGAGTPSNIGITMGLVDSVGTGAIGAIYQNGSLFTWVLTTWADGTSGGSVASGMSQDGRHQWLSIKRVSTTLTARWSSNGTSFTSFTSGSAVSATAPYIALLWPTANGASPGWVRLYRLNVYPGPTFFPG